MIALWMLYCTVTTLLLGIAAVVGERTLPSALPRRWIWAVTLVASLLFGATAWFAPVPADPSDTSDRVLTMWEGTPAKSRAAQVREPDERQTAEITAPRQQFDSTLIVLWLALSGAYAGVLGASALSLRLQRRRWTASMVHGRPVQISDSLGPAVVGFFRPVVVLPRWALSMDAQTRGLMVAHENEHLRASDQRLLALSLLIPVLAPWNLPLLWQVRRLRHAMELDCDARVLRRGVDVKSYGALLLEVSRRPSPRTFAVASFAEPISYLERRIRAMIAKKPKRGWAGAIFSAGAVALLLLVACEVPRPLGPGGAEPAGNPSAARGLPEEQRVAPSPSRARLIANAIASRHPTALNGLTKDQAVWFIVDDGGAILESWIGVNFTDDAWLSWMQQRRYPKLIITPMVSQVAVGPGRSVEVVWARERKQWEILPGGMRPKRIAEIRDTIARIRPEVIERGIPEGEAVWLIVRHVPGTYGSEVQKSWIAPGISDRRAQWEYLRGIIPEGEAEVLLSANFEVKSETGQKIPVVLTTAADLER